MRLLDLTVRRVRRHRELRLAFDPRFTLVGGANETGKSTLVEALHKGLFLKASATGRGVEELRSRLHPGLPEVEIGFAAAGRQWRLRKRFAGASGTCQLSHDDGLSLHGAEAEERLAELLGVEGAVEGRRIAQLPLRWAHLWVRQGEAGANLLAAPGEAYDLPRLVEQLQQGHGAGAALESSLDRRVIDTLRQRLDQQFTATGKVRAGSPLALARQRVEQLRQQRDAALARRDGLEACLEDLRAIEERLEQIEQRQAPALEALRRGQGERQLQRAELGSLEEQRRQLQQRLSELQQLGEQERQLRQEQEQLLAQGQELQHQLGEAERQLALLRERSRSLEQRGTGLASRRQLAQLLLDQEQLQREETQRLEHQARFEQLQRQADGLKGQLAALAAIGPSQLAPLRQAQLQLAAAEARRQAHATSLELLAADQPVQLDGEALAPGIPVQLLRSGELVVGKGVRLRLGPAAEAAPLQAEQQWQQCRQALADQLGQLGVADLAEAETIAAHRASLESELGQLRQAASAIPWARLRQDASEQEQRRQRLAAALQGQAALLEALGQAGELPAGREALEQWREQLASDTAQLEQERSQLQRQLELAQGTQAQRDQQQRGREQRLQQLQGSRGTLAERLERLQAEHGGHDALERQLAHHDEAIGRRRQALASLDAQLLSARRQAGLPNDAPTDSDAEPQLRQLQAEKEALLQRRGQHQQAIQSLSAEDPAAAVEQQQAQLEQAEAELGRLDLQVGALQQLLEQLEAARSSLSQRYSQPLSEAVGHYLNRLACPGYAPGLDFEPNQGLSNLQLRQGEEGFRFEELSGGMREQLNGALRLAIAEVLAPAYDGTLPLLFDDAFTNTDPQRQSGLRQMLQLAIERGLQIVLLSCTPELYGPLLGQGGLHHQLEA